MKTTRILALLLCFALLFATVALASCKKKQENAEEQPTVEVAPTPEEIYRNMSAEEKLATSVRKAGATIENWEDVAAISKVLSTAVQSGSVELELTLDEETTGLDQAAYIKAKIWANETKYALKANAIIGKETIDANAYIDPNDRIVVESNKFLGGAYGVDMKSLASDLTLMLGSMDQLDTLTEAADSYLGMIPAAVEKIPELLAGKDELIEKELGLLLATILANTSVSAEQKTVSSMDREVAATCLTLTIDNNAVAAILGSFYNALRDDAEVMDLINEIMEMIPAEESDVTGATEEIDLLAILDQEVAAAIEKIRSAAPFEVKVVVSTDALGSIVRIDAAFDFNEMPVTISLEVSEADNELAGLRLTANITAQEGVTITASLNVSIEKTANGKVIRIYTTGLSNLLGMEISGSISYDKKTGATRLYAEARVPEAEEPAMSYEVNCIYKIENSTFTFGHLEIKQNGIVMPGIPDFVLTIRENDTMPQAPETYKNVLKLNDKEMDALMEKVTTEIAPYAEIFEDLFGDEKEEDQIAEWVMPYYYSTYWDEITETAVPEQQEYVNSEDYTVYACPIDDYAEMEQMIGAAEGTLKDMFLAIDDSTFVFVFTFDQEASAEACYQEMNFHGEYDLSGTSFVGTTITATYWKETNEGYEWTEVTESSIPELAALLKEEYYLSECPADALPYFESSIEAQEGSLKSAFNATMFSEEKSITIEFFYFNSADLASKYYRGLDLNDEWYDYAINGDLVTRTRVTTFGEGEGKGEGEGEGEAEITYEPALADKAVLEKQGYSVAVFTDAETIAIYEQIIQAEEGSVVCLLSASATDSGSSTIIFYFETEAQAAACYEASWKNVPGYIQDGNKLTVQV